MNFTAAYTVPFDRPMPPVTVSPLPTLKQPVRQMNADYRSLFQAGQQFGSAGRPRKLDDRIANFHMGCCRGRAPVTALLKRPPFCPCITPSCSGANFIWLGDLGPNYTLFSTYHLSFSRGGQSGSAPALPGLGGPSDPSDPSDPLALHISRN